MAKKKTAAVLLGLAATVCSIEAIEEKISESVNHPKPFVSFREPILVADAEGDPVHSGHLFVKSKA